MTIIPGGLPEKTLVASGGHFGTGPSDVRGCQPYLFQKDSSSYKHKVETSEDGERWELLYERECTGWEFKPMTVDREVKYVRLTIENVSEGRAGLGEISLY